MNQNSMIAILEQEHGMTLVSIFGRKSSGLPGLEIVGIGTSYARKIVEKFIFLSRNRNLPIGSKKYVLCVEILGTRKERPNPLEVKWLELPLLILYWSLAEVLPIYRLTDCLGHGEVRVSGQIALQRPDKNKFKELLQDKNEVTKYLTLPEIDHEIQNTLHLIDLRSLFGQIPNLQFLSTS